MGTYIQITTCEVTYLEIKGNWWSDPLLLLLRWYKMDISCKQALCIPLEPLESPNNRGLILRFISCLSSALWIDPYVCSCFWHWDTAYYRSCKVRWVKDRFYPYWNLYFAQLRILLNHWNYFEWEIYILRYPVSHYIKCSIWGYESDWAVAVKLA